MGLTTDDLLEIQSLVSRYNHAVDSGQGAAFADTFTESGALLAGELVVEGREALEKFAATVPERNRAPRHIASNLMIDGDGERATLDAYVQMFTLVGDPPRQEIAVSGRYADKLVKADGHWRFVRRVFTRDA